MTVAIYQKTAGGLLRHGLFRVRRYHGVNEAGRQFMEQHPHFPPDSLYVAPRLKLMGVWVDGEPLKWGPNS